MTLRTQTPHETQDTNTTGQLGHTHTHTTGQLDTNTTGHKHHKTGYRQNRTVRHKHHRTDTNITGQLHTIVYQ